MITGNYKTRNIFYNAVGKYMEKSGISLHDLGKKIPFFGRISFYDIDNGNNNDFLSMAAG